MFTKYKQLILSMFVLICCLTDTTQAKSYITLSDQYTPHCVVLDHHYKHLSRHALRKTTLAMHRAHQKALGACKRAYYHSIKHYEARTCPHAEYRVQQHELLKNLAQLQAQCAFSQEQTARTLQATQQTLQLQQESTAALINQLKEKLAFMQQQYTTLEQKYRRLEELTKERQELPLEKELQQEPQDMQDMQAQEQQEQQQNQQNNAQELPGQQPDSAEQQAALEELLGKKRAARESQSHAEAPVLESKEPQPELESELQTESDNTNTQEPVQQQQTVNNAQDQANPQEVEVLVPEEEVSGKSMANNNNDQNDQDDEDAAFEQRLLNLLQEKQETIKTLSQQLERERTQARTTIARLQQELTNHQTALKEALEVLTTGEQPQQQRAEQAAASIERVLQRAPEQQELEHYQTTLADVLNLYDQQATEKKMLRQSLTQAQNYIDQQKTQEKQAQQALQETKNELIGTNKQLARALYGFDNEHKQRQELENRYNSLAAKPSKSVVNQETQTDAQTQAIEHNSVQEPGKTVQVGCVSLASLPRIDRNGEKIYTDYTLTVTVDGKTIVMNTHDNLDQNKQATDELIKALENVSEEKLTEIQNYLQEAFSNFSLVEQIKFLRPLFYKSKPLQCPHPTIAVLITPSLTSLSDTDLEKNINLGTHQSTLEKMLNANIACLDNLISVNNQDMQDLNQNLSDGEDNIQPEQIIEVPQEHEQTQAPAQESQRAWYNPLRWLGR